MNRKEGLIKRLRERGYKHIEDDVYDIAHRINEYDGELLLFFNPFIKRYEIHSCTSFPSNRPTYCVSSYELDYRIINSLRWADNRSDYGFKEKMDDIEKSYDLEEKRKSQTVEDMQKEVKNDVKTRLKMKQHFHMGGD